MKEKLSSIKKVKKKLSMGASNNGNVELVEKILDNNEEKRGKMSMVISKVKKGSKDKVSSKDISAKKSKKRKLSNSTETTQSLDKPNVASITANKNTNLSSEFPEGSEKVDAYSLENSDSVKKESSKTSKKKKKLFKDLPCTEAGKAVKDDLPKTLKSAHMDRTSESQSTFGDMRPDKDAGTTNTCSEYANDDAKPRTSSTVIEKGANVEPQSKTKSSKSGSSVSADPKKVDVAENRKSSKKDKSKKRKKHNVSDDVDCTDAVETSQLDIGKEELTADPNSSPSDPKSVGEDKVNKISKSKKSKKLKLCTEVKNEAECEEPNVTKTQKSKSHKRSEIEGNGSHTDGEVLADNLSTASGKKKKKKDHSTTQSGENDAVLENGLDGNVNEALDATDKLPADENCEMKNAKSSDNDQHTTKMEMNKPDYVETEARKSRRASDGDITTFDRKRLIESFNKRNRRQSLGSKSNEPFKRVRESDVVFRDERLRDNSFHSKYDTYGTQAHQDLSVVKGKGFRKEKTKKKRLNHHGGKLGYEVNSFKFSDDSD